MSPYPTGPPHSATLPQVLPGYDYLVTTHALHKSPDLQFNSTHPFEHLGFQTSTDWKTDRTSVVPVEEHETSFAAHFAVLT